MEDCYYVQTCGDHWRFRKMFYHTVMTIEHCVFINIHGNINT